MTWWPRWLRGFRLRASNPGWRRPDIEQHIAEAERALAELQHEVNLIRRLRAPGSFKGHAEGGERES